MPTIPSIPGGTGGMLRSRRRDANVKPNRLLDRNSSRGMIFENEELRLRTININEEIERGQNDIKKLRRENEHLRREIWALREECDRLQELLKRQEEEEDEEESDEEEEEEGKEDKPERKFKNKKFELDGLSVVPEEPEDNISTAEQPSNRQKTPLKDNPERGLEEYKGVKPTPCLRINSVHPFTAAATVDPNLFPRLNVSEVIQEAVKVSDDIVGIRLISGSVYLSCNSKETLAVLIDKGLTLRDTKITLHDVSHGTVVVALSGVPHHLTDDDLAHVLSQFGPVIGGVERRLFCDVDTGERLSRIRLQGTLPKRLFLQGSEISMRPLPHEELFKLSMQQHCLPKLHIGEIEQESSDLGTLSTTCETANTSTNPFTFPVNSTPLNASSKYEDVVNRLENVKSTEEKSASAPEIPISNPGSPAGSVRRGNSDGETKRSLSKTRRVSRRGPSPMQSSSSEQESPNKPRRRRSSVFQPPIGFERYDRDRSPSLSSRASYGRRKMSATGRESGKLPWCACWGNGCV